MFLKDRGDAMHRSANYRAAVNAFTKALELDATLSVCYANRAASYLKMQEYRQGNTDTLRYNPRTPGLPTLALVFCYMHTCLAKNLHSVLTLATPAHVHVCLAWVAALVDIA